ncbi:junctophilin-1 isoform X2 [Neocloeon triangulifer]|uniref:junctophilin-1 isoform X2 n=1 Tax=Neocloeon triangulifer TaxID=2078957 RepID=UPI00286F5E99|nr:junctophilin-1 isoform X2 [Neocloeon triangulifer]
MQNQQQQQQAAAGPPQATPATGVQAPKGINGGRFDFDDGGTYCGGWEDGKAHGHGVCTGPKGQGAYSGSWHFGFEVSGVYMWPSGSTFEGQWQNGKRHGLGVETRGRWLYRGEWTQGFKGRYGVRQSATSNAKYEGTWANGLQDGYGSETYADGGTFQGQWLRGMRHGYGVRASAPFGLASHYRPTKQLRASMTSLRSDNGAGGVTDPATERDRRVDDSRGGFVLKARSDDPPVRRRSLVESSKNLKKSILQGLKMRKQRSTGDLEKRGTSASLRSTGSSASWVSTDSAHSAVTAGSDEQMDTNVTETYMGEWKNDKRSGFGISERSDGLKYEGEWFNNKKYGYGVTTLKDGSREEGKYKNNVLITSHKKKHLFLIRSAKFRERIDAAVNAAQRASKIALQKADIAISRTATARGKAELADMAAEHAREDSDIARATAKQFAPDFQQPGLEKLRQLPKYRPTIEPIQTKAQLQQQMQLQEQQHELQAKVASALPPSLQQNQHQATPPRPVPVAAVPPPAPYQSQYAPPQPPPARAPSIPPPEPEPQAAYKPLANNLENGELSVPKQLGPNLRRGGTARGTEPGVDNPAYSFQQAMSDHFDHYKRAPSRDSSVDRYTRATRMSRQPSAEAPSIAMAANLAAAAGSTTPLRGRTPFGREGSVEPSKRVLMSQASTEKVPPSNGSVIGGDQFGVQPPFEDIIMKKKSLGQDIIPSLANPKRTESLFVNVNRKEPAVKNIPVATPVQRKKSLPDVQTLPRQSEPMSREEASILSSMQRETVRRRIEEDEKLRANPLLWLVSPHVKDWFSRQQLVFLVLFINISLAIMFFKLLT